ncbi:MAG: hypothetical protein WKF77_30540 [Planctomycetaceae bacterium]
MFSPLLTSMRVLQQASELDKVQKKLGVGRTSFGSFSEAVRVFDPEPLKQIAAELPDQIPQPGQGRFDSIGKTMTAVDGSVVDTIVRVARLAWLPKAGGKMNCGYRLHTHFEIFGGTASRVDVTGSKPKGEADERAVMARTVESDRRYLMKAIADMCRVVYAAAAILAFSGACEAGYWQSNSGTATTINSDTTFYIRVYAVDQSYQTVQEPDVQLTLTSTSPNTPYPGMTTYSHTHGPITVIGNFVHVYGQVWVHPSSGNDYQLGSNAVSFSCVP